MFQFRTNKRVQRMALIFIIAILRMAIFSLSSSSSSRTTLLNPSSSTKTGHTFQPYLFLIPVRATHESRQTRLTSNICSLAYPPKNEIAVRFLSDPSSESIITKSFEQLVNCGITDLQLIKDSTFVRGEGKPQPYSSSSSFSSSSSESIEPHLTTTEESIRHSYNTQYSRRSKLSEARNYLVYTTLRPWHKSIIFLDSDLLSFTGNDGSLLKILEETNGDIVVPNCLNADGEKTYDLNSWRETPTSLLKVKALADDVAIFEGYATNNFGRLHLDDIRDLITSGNVENMKANGLLDLLPSTKPKETYSVELDGIGGTLIFVKADVFRMGVNFPSVLINHQLETEGFAQLAKIRGFSVLGMPFLYIRHA